ncbi:SRPBCC family protein [Streptomyces gamaensis]|uniref:SRPBCC family protein n=1 Tax=Streptomyces gamaensis TaxID=1763542 RepID=A0ABW0YSD7_9ACTN
MSSSASVYIGCPPDAAYAVLADPDNWPRVNRGVTLRTARVAGDPGRPLAGGDVFIEYAAGPAENGVDFEFPWNVQESTPNARLTVMSRAELGPGHHCLQTITFEFAPSGPGTLYTRTFRVDFADGLLEAAPKEQACAFQDYLGRQYAMAMKLKRYIEGGG